MDISAIAFPAQLPRVLDDLATCSFVAIDLEFSGINMSADRIDRSSDRTQTLQERYEEVKNAAEKYQVLQVGLTMCHEDTDTGAHGSEGIKTAFTAEN